MQDKIIPCGSDIDRGGMSAESGHEGQSDESIQVLAWCLTYPVLAVRPIAEGLEVYAGFSRFHHRVGLAGMTLFDLGLRKGQ